MTERVEQTLSQRLLLNYRRLVVVMVHLALWVASFAFAFFLRFEFTLPDEYIPRGYEWLAVLLALRTISFAVFGLFSFMWRYTGAKDLVALFKATTVSSVLFALFILMFGFRSFPRSILIIDWLTTMILVGGLRFGVRTLFQLAANLATKGESKRLLIVGAGDAGEMLLREMQKSYASRYNPVAFADDDSRKFGQRLHGVPVMGPLTIIPKIVEQHEVQEIVIAIPTATGKQMRRILELCKPAGLPIRTIPGISQVIDGQVTLNQLRDVDIEDLLGRDPVTLDQRALTDLLGQKVVMVTGAGGSIGSELCRQIARFKPSKLLLVERAEPALFEVHRELERVSGVTSVPCIADICDEKRMSQLFAEHRPQVVLHAAAHKHVPMMELNPGEAVKNNVGGTRLMADLAHANGVDAFVMISTDKAVNPTSVMGATKRVAEIYVQALSQRSKTRFTAVRFGNVLGSAGSVLPIFRQQIAKGGPVTVTHPEMRRYFMTIPEASQLVLQAGAMGRGGEIFVLDMGEPVKIADLARDLITLTGLKPGVDVEIQFTGMRPGEKLFEELSTRDENADKTLHPKIFIGRLSPRPHDAVSKEIAALLEIAFSGGGMAVLDKIRLLVPELQREDVAEPPQLEAPVIPLRRPSGVIG
jgi:FlaA1/EpsC-like NDP-sugar epimerase